MASGGDNLDEQKNTGCHSDSPQRQIQIPYIVTEANDYVHQIKQFSAHLIAHCTIYNNIYNKLLKKSLQNDQVVKCQPDIVGSLRNDLKAMNVMFGMMKMFCEQIVRASNPDLNCFPTLKMYFSQTVNSQKKHGGRY